MTNHFKPPFRFRKIARAGLMLLASFSIMSTLAFGLFVNNTLATGGVTYYVDCNGRDTNNGTSTTSAWRSLAKANSAPLVPGDRLLFKRGCTWIGTLKAYWNGTATLRIIIGAYGTGASPKFQNSSADLTDKYYDAVDITGSYMIIQNLDTNLYNPPVDPGCNNNPIGFYIGFHFRNPNNLANGASYNTLRFSQATHFTAGVHLGWNTHHNRIAKNVFKDNNVMQILTPKSVNANDDIGAWGLVLNGSNQEVAYNQFSNNNAWCTYDTPPQGNSIELYEGVNNVIHHNISINDRDFSELGGSTRRRSDNNLYAYNLVISSIVDSHFIIARGAGNVYGPTYRTKLFQNTVYYTGAKSQGIICGAGCSSDILIAKNNIIWAEWKAAYADNAFTESNNIYWNSSGAPIVQFQNFYASSTSMVANPKFTDPSNQNFHLQTNSPAIDNGMSFGWQKDLDCTAIPQGSGNDIGVYEYSSSIASVETSPGNNSFKINIPLILSSVLDDVDFSDLTAVCP